MNRTSWERILSKYYEGEGKPNEPVEVIFKTSPGYAYGLIKEIDEDFLVIEKARGEKGIIGAIVELNEVAGFRIR